MSMNRADIQYEQADQEHHRNSLCQTEETYQEDKAFLNRMKKIPPYKMQAAEIQRLTRIAWRGMEARK